MNFSSRDVYEAVARELKAHNSLDYIYAKFSNQLALASEELSYDHEFLLEVNKRVEKLIVYEYMRDKGWHQHEEKFLTPWEREE